MPGARDADALRQRLHELGELSLATGEAGDITWQSPGRRRRRRARLQTVPGREHVGGLDPAPGRRDKQPAHRFSEVERAGQQLGGVLVGGAVDPALQVAY